jgi:biopolymer transport protein ExbD
VDPVLVKVLADGKIVDHEKQNVDADGLASKAGGLHEEYESFSAGYADSAATTAWTVEADGKATTGSVLAAVDALRRAGIKACKLGLAK